MVRLRAYELSGYENGLGGESDFEDIGEGGAYISDICDNSEWDVRAESI